MYLTGADAQQKLIDLEIYTSETVPSVILLTRVLLGIQSQIDNWLNGTLERKTYTEILSSSYSGQAVTSYYPLLAILSIEAPPNHWVGYIPPIDRAWTGTIRTLNFWNQQVALKVTYEAGYDPVPQELIDKVFEILLIALEQKKPGDLAFLNETAKDVEEIQLPGNLRKRFKVQQPAAGAAKESQLDRLLASLSHYRKHILTVGS